MTCSKIGVGFFSPKMDGENSGSKPELKMDDLGGFPYFWKHPTRPRKNQKKITEGEHPNTLPKMDTQNEGLEKVAPFKHGNFWYLC